MWRLLLNSEPPVFLSCCITEPGKGLQFKAPLQLSRIEGDGNSGVGALGFPSIEGAKVMATSWPKPQPGPCETLASEPASWAPTPIPVQNFCHPLSGPAGLCGASLF